MKEETNFYPLFWGILGFPFDIRSTITSTKLEQPSQRTLKPILPHKQFQSILKFVSDPYTIYRKVFHMPGYQAILKMVQ